MRTPWSRHRRKAMSTSSVPLRIPLEDVEVGERQTLAGLDRLIRSLTLQSCRERGHVRVLGLKEPVARKVLDLVLVE
jgi:hypothetical protein